MGIRVVALAFVSLFSICACAVAADGPQMGWRGDGSGRYPDANPPLDWGRIARSVKEMSAQARKPKEGAMPAADAAIPDGVIRQWLVLGPLPVTEEKEPDAILPGAPTLSPDENEKSGEKSWRAVKLDTDVLDLASVMNIAPEQTGFAAYAHTYLYSPSGEAVAWNFMCQGQGTHRLWLNGKAVYASESNIDLFPGIRVVLPLVKGWNRLLVLNAKTISFRKSWWFSGCLYGEKTKDYETHGIVWSTPLPNPGSSAPVIMGDRLFVTTEGGAVTCINKADGKILWVHSLTFYDFATEEERKANPQIFTELDPLGEELKQLDVTDCLMPWKGPALEKDFRWSIDPRIDKGMAKVSRAKYAPQAECEAGTTAPAPISDGHYVYAVFGNGICACYDRDGNRKWSRLLDHVWVEHGYTSPPLLVDGKLIVYFNNFTVLDAATGKTILERPHFIAPGKSFNWYSNFHATGSVLQAGNETVLYYLNGEFVRLSDGKTLALDEKKLTVLGPQYYSNGEANRMAAVVVDKGIAYKIVENKGGVVMFRLPPLQGDKVDPEIVREIPYATAKFPYYYQPVHCASPLLYQGLLYCLNDFGTLTVLDVGTGQVVYQRQLDLDIFMPYSLLGLLKGGASSSPTLAGKYIYIFGNQGTTLILEPGRTYKQIAKLRLENVSHSRATFQEATMTEPVFEGERLYYHAEATVYCIGRE